MNYKPVFNFFSLICFNQPNVEIGELQVLLADKENHLQRVISDFKSKENQASHDIQDLENQLHYKNQEFLNFEESIKGLNL